MPLKPALTTMELEALMRTDVTNLIKRTIVLLKMQGHPLAGEWAAVAAPLAWVTYNVREKEFEERKRRGV